MVPSTDPDAHNFIEQQFVTEMVWEKFFANRKSFDVHTRLDTIPLWLTEGLREWLNDDAEHDREAIVHRAVAGGRAPSLEEVTGWTTLSDDRLLGMWQRAFCFYLVDSLHAKGRQAGRFSGMAQHPRRPQPPECGLSFPDRGGLAAAVGPKRPAAAVTSSIRGTRPRPSLRRCRRSRFRRPHGADTRICTLDTVETFQRDASLAQALQAKVYDLTGLELRAHPGWRPVIQLYRFGLTALYQRSQTRPGRDAAA